jgi:hypothetical protein
MKLSTKLLLKCAEECSEASAALLQFVNKQHNGEEEAKDLREAFSKELGDVSAFTCLLLNFDIVDSKLLWAKYEEKTEKWTKRVEAMLEEANGNKHKATDDGTST